MKQHRNVPNSGKSADMRDFNRIKQVAVADCEYLIDPDQPGCQNRLWIIKLVKNWYGTEFPAGMVVGYIDIAW